MIEFEFKVNVQVEAAREEELDELGQLDTLEMKVDHKIERELRSILEDATPGDMLELEGEDWEVVGWTVSS